MSVHLSIWHLMPSIGDDVHSAALDCVCQPFPVPSEKFDDVDWLQGYMVFQHQKLSPLPHEIVKDEPELEKYFAVNEK